MSASRRRDDAVFWDRLAEMPAWEAEQECVTRRESLVLENAMLGGEQVRAAGREHGAICGSIRENNAQISRLVERIKYLRKLQDRVHWRETVRELFGDEAVEQCVVHIEQKWADVYGKRREWAR
jgi:hypothetical protein